MISDPAVLDLAVGPALVPVLGRIVNAIGGQADIELDRLGDLEVLAETLSASVHHFTPDGRVRFALTPEAGVVVVRVGPLVGGGAEGLRAACALPDLGPVIDHARRLGPDRHRAGRRVPRGHRRIGAPQRGRRRAGGFGLAASRHRRTAPLRRIRTWEGLLRGFVDVVARGARPAPVTGGGGVGSSAACLRPDAVMRRPP